MARVREVIQRDLPAGPDSYGSKEAALAAEPDKPIVDAQFATRAQAKNAAYRINGGEREEWPRDKYFAIFALNPEPGEPDEHGNVEDLWELLILPRTLPVPDAWVKEVNAPGSRRKRRGGSVDDSTHQSNDNGEMEEQESHEESMAA